MAEADRPIVVLAEDDPDLNAQIRDALEPDFECLCAAHGGEALQLIVERVPDLVISDVMMPEMDGLALCRAIKAHPVTCHIPVVLLTARAGETATLQGFAAAAIEYLVKPVSGTQLRHRVAALLSAQRAWRDRARAEIERSHTSASSPERPVGPTIEDSALTPSDLDFLERLNAAIDSRYMSREFNVVELASTLAVSDRQLRRKTVALLGEVPSQYLKRYRLTRARELLTQGAMAKQAAYATGFESASHFSRAFVEEFGVPPSAVARQ